MLFLPSLRQRGTTLEAVWHKSWILSWLDHCENWFAFYLPVIERLVMDVFFRDFFCVQLLQMLECCVDFLSTLGVILLIAMAGLLGVVFVAMQIHSETSHIIRLSTSVMAQQPDWLSFAKNITEGQVSELDIDYYVEQVG